MGMTKNVARQWKNLKDCLRNCGIYRSLESDVLTWKDTKGPSQVRVKDIYQNLIASRNVISNPTFPSIFWKFGCLSKSIYFSWLVFHNKNLSWDNFKKRGWQGPGLCSICKFEEETNCHMFFLCQKTQQLWQAQENLYGFPHVSHSSSKEAFFWWSGQKESWRPIFIIALWCIWRWRNKKVFKESKEPFMGTLQSITSLFDSLPEKPLKEKRPNPNMNVLSHNMLPRAYFDGAAQNNSCGCGIHIIMDENTQYLISWNGGKNPAAKWRRWLSRVFFLSVFSLTYSLFQVTFNFQYLGIPKSW